MRVYRAHARLSKCMMLAGSALMLSGMPAAAWAQEAQSPGSTQTADTRANDIVVTAQKREERLQEVPISIAVVSAKTLDTFSMNEATDLQYIVPGVQVLNAAGPRRPSGSPATGRASVAPEQPDCRASPGRSCSGSAAFRGQPTTRCCGSSPRTASAKSSGPTEPHSVALSQRPSSALRGRGTGRG